MLGFGDMVVGLPVETAQTWAETVLSQVAEIRGVESFMFTLGMVTRTIRPPSRGSEGISDR